MHPVPQLRRQHCIDHAVLFDTRLGTKRICHDLHPEMALAIGPSSGVTGVLVGFVDHFQILGRESIR